MRVIAAFTLLIAFALADAVRAQSGLVENAGTRADVDALMQKLGAAERDRHFPEDYIVRSLEKALVHEKGGTTLSETHGARTLEEARSACRVCEIVMDDDRWITPARQPVCDATVMLETKRWGRSPFAYMRLANREGWFDLDTGAVMGHVDAKTFGLTAGSQATLTGSSLPTISGGGIFLVNDYPQERRETGIIGTIGNNLLSQRIVEFHYDVAAPYMVISEPQCPHHFEDAGFVAIDQQGYFSSSPQPLRPNIPVIFVRIGAVAAPVEIDSGFAEGVNDKHAHMFVNELLLQKLRLAGVRMEMTKTAKYSDCTGHPLETQLWQVQDAPLIFTNREGQALLSYGPPNLEVQQPSSCGGVASLNEAVGSVGALQLARLGTTIFDGPHQRLWVRRNPSASPEPLYRAMAVAWNMRGAFTWTFDNSADRATAKALSICNEKNGNCTLAGSISGSSFACGAVARNLRQTAKISYASRGSLDQARNAALQNCTRTHGSSCKIEHSACND